MLFRSGGQQDYNPYNPTGAAGYNPYHQPSAYPPQPYTSAGPAPVPTPSPPRPTSVVDPYGGYIDEPTPAPGHVSPPPQPQSPPQGGNTYADGRAPSPSPGKLLSGNFASPPASSEGHEQEDQHRMSIQDDDDYGYEPGRRVLKVSVGNRR